MKTKNILFVGILILMAVIVGVFVVRMIVTAQPTTVGTCTQIDLDSDGVLNCIDLCPTTPMNTAVDKNGCTLLENIGLNKFLIIPLIMIVVILGWLAYMVKKHY